MFAGIAYFTGFWCFNFLLLDFKTAAKFLLVVEKDASFQHIVGSNFIETAGPCIVATVSSAH